MSANTPLTVTELTARIKQVLEQGFAQVEVTGEISRLTTPSSGHLYFTIKDAHAAISAVVWRTTALRLKTRPKEGQAYVFIGHISLYEPRGIYQLVIKRIEAVGAGRLAAEFERRKQVFAERGWFDSEHKRPIPKLPQHIGVVTSTTAAAFEDVKKVLATRPAWLTLTLSPCLVQGEQAPDSIVKAIQRFSQLKKQPDIILLVRGGGSIEDLWCFNDERVIQAIFDADIPIISGVGHEIDTTLADLVADFRAATPSNAAELACPSRDTLRQQMPQLKSMVSLLLRRLAQNAEQNQNFKQHLTQARNRFQDQNNWKLERLTSKHGHTFRQVVRQRQQQHKTLNLRLTQQEPNQLLRHDMQSFFALKQRLSPLKQIILQHRQSSLDNNLKDLQTSHQNNLRLRKQVWQRFSEQLHAMNPDHVLQRGYAMTTNQYGHIISSVEQLKEDTIMHFQYADGSADSKVVKIHKGQPSSS